MNNKEAFNLLCSQPSIRAASDEFIRYFQVPESEYHCIRRKFAELKSNRQISQKNSDLKSWEELLFHSYEIKCLPKRRLSEDRIIFEADLSIEIRKPLSQLTTKALKTRLASLLNLIETLAVKEEVDNKTIASYGLQLVSNLTHDRNTSSFCKEIISTGSFGTANKRIPIDKSTFLIDKLEIGKRKYLDLKRTLKSENVILPSYKDIAQYRSEITLNNEFQLILNDNQVTIGIRIPYRKILIQTLSRLLLTLPQVNETHFPLTLKIADGLDGSGSYQMYNQLQESVNFNTKNFIIFAFKLLSIKDSYNCQIWQNTLPNSHFPPGPLH